jgi:hypothetical protein
MALGRRLDSETDAEVLAHEVNKLSQTLWARAFWLVVTTTGGLAMVFGVMFYLWRDWKLGYGVHPPFYEAAIAAAVGAFMGAGMSLPFGYWFRAQAGLMLVQLKMEENTRRAREEAAETARSVRNIAHAGMTGEWSALADSLDAIPSVSSTDQLRPVEDID